MRLQRNSSLVFLWILAYLVSGSWTPEQFQAWVSSHGVGLKSNQMLVGHPTWHSFLQCLSLKQGKTLHCPIYLSEPPGFQPHTDTQHPELLPFLASLRKLLHTTFISAPAPAPAVFSSLGGLDCSLLSPWPLCVDLYYCHNTQHCLLSSLPRGPAL